MDLGQMLRWLTLRHLLIWDYIGSPGEGGTVITYRCAREDFPLLTWRTLTRGERLVAVALDAQFDEGTFTTTSSPLLIPGAQYVGLFGTYIELRLSIEIGELYIRARDRWLACHRSQSG